MNILLTGARGFIGRHTMRGLLEAGHTVRPADKKPGDDMRSGGLWWDITDRQRLEVLFEVCDHFDAIIHLAANASLQRSLAAPAYDAEQNIIGTINLLELAREYGVGRFVFASTSAVYSPTAPQPLEERQAWLGPVSPYGISKLACEYHVQVSGLQYACLRYANVYGPGQKPVGENALVARALNHIVYGYPFLVNGDGEQVRDWIFVADVVAANLAALEAPDSGVYNISTGRGYSVNEVLRLLDGRRSWQHGPEKPGELRKVVMLNSSALSYLGWSPLTPLVDGLRYTAANW